MGWWGGGVNEIQRHKFSIILSLDSCQQVLHSDTSVLWCSRTWLKSWEVTYHTLSCLCLMHNVMQFWNAVCVNAFPCNYSAESDCSNPSLNDCHVNATCTDIPGSHACVCVDGYAGNGTFCRSTFECLCLVSLLAIHVLYFVWCLTL